MADDGEKKRGRGHPLLLTPAVQAKIVHALEVAVPIRFASKSAGISYEAVKVWMRRGEDGEEPYAEFLAEVQRAKGQAVVGLTDLALRGGKGSAQATWILERRYREEYGPVNKIDQTVDLNLQKLINAFEPPNEEEAPEDFDSDPAEE